MAEGNLKGRVALVTGAGKRIGRSIALRLAREGMDVAVNYSRSQTEANAVVAEARNAGVRAVPIQADVSRSAEVRRMMSAVERELGRLDLLVNNAGMFEHARFEQMSEEQWDRMIDTNLKSQFLCAQAAVPLLRASGRGRIVNISSLGGMLPWPGFVHYCVSKAGVIMLTRCLARALAPEILVNSVAPGTIQFPGEPPDEDYIHRAPLGRTGTGDDIAEAVLFLARSDFITGQVLAVDGGRALT
jgi:3-oxoacyl-[acyl-carrier protein] reductase/pteridine reductase